MNTLISLFIDDEMRIDEKCAFVGHIREDTAFFDETMGILQQEKLLQADAVDRVPHVDVRVPVSWQNTLRRMLFPAGMAATALACAMLVLVFWPSQMPERHLKRFVLYQPDARQIEITGTFTNWKRIPMQKLGTSGYWEIELELSEGEHKFTYMLERDRPYADPTVLMSEKDGFGGTNSILHVEGRA